MFIDGPLKWSEWNELLPANDIDRDYILNGVQYGFKLYDSDLSHVPEVETNNYSSCFKYFNLVEQQIQYELMQGNYVISEDKPQIISALGAIPKSPTKIRLIHDASRPQHMSLNDYILAEADCSCTYMDIREAIKHIKPGSFLAKVDLSNAYRSVAINPANYSSTGLKWTFSGHNKPTYMFDCRLPFGVSRSPQIFQRLSAAVCRILKTRFGFTVIAYLDDFLIVEQSADRCRLALNTLLSVLRKLGFSINWSKLVGPTTRLVFLGVVIDSVKMTLELPDDKLCEFTNLLRTYVTKRRASKAQLETLCGKLSWASQVICGGRTFLRRMITLKDSITLRQQKVILSDDFRQDLSWWLIFMQTFNGSCSILDPKPITSLQTDACNQGAGAYYNGDYMYTNWKLDMPPICDQHINIKELVAIFLAVCRWREHFRDHKVVIYTDNKSAASWVNKGSSRSEVSMLVLRLLFWFCAYFNFSLKCIYLPGARNIVADRCSRLHEQNALSKLYDLLPSLCLLPFSLEHLANHMSYCFLLCRWNTKISPAIYGGGPEKEGVG